MLLQPVMCPAQTRDQPPLRSCCGGGTGDWVIADGLRRVHTNLADDGQTGTSQKGPRLAQCPEVQMARDVVLWTWPLPTEAKPDHAPLERYLESDPVPSTGHRSGRPHWLLEVLEDVDTQHEIDRRLPGLERLDPPWHKVGIGQARRSHREHACSNVKSMEFRTGKRPPREVEHLAGPASEFQDSLWHRRGRPDQLLKVGPLPGGGETLVVLDQVVACPLGGPVLVERPEVSHATLIR